MKPSRSFLGIFALPLTLATVSYACIKPSHVVTALDAVQIACILVSETVDDEATLAKVCGVSEELIPEVRKVVLARKTAAAHKASASASASAVPAAGAGKSDAAGDGK